jgi:hypothetical protein
MTGTSRITDRLLEELSLTWYTDYDYMGTGTSPAAVADDDTDLTNPVQIGAAAANRNKVAETGTTESFIDGVSWTRLFLLNTVEPNTQPVNLREFGSFKTEADNNDMGSRLVTNVAHTKDNTISFKVRFSGRTNRTN